MKRMHSTHPHARSRRIDPRENKPHPIRCTKHTTRMTYWFAGTVAQGPGFLQDAPACSVRPSLHSQEELRMGEALQTKGGEKALPCSSARSVPLKGVMGE